MITNYMNLTLYNFVGNYEIKEIDGISTIISDTCFPSAKNEEPLKRKKIELDLYKNNEHLLILLANVDLSSKESILSFCNSYGLPFSSVHTEAKHLNKSLLGLEIPESVYAKITPYYRNDHMTEYEFRHHVFSARRILNVYNDINSSSPEINHLFTYLIPLLLYERMGLFDFNDDATSCCHTPTTFFQFYYLKTRAEKCRSEKFNLAYEFFNILDEIKKEYRSKDPLIPKKLLQSEEFKSKVQLLCSFFENDLDLLNAIYTDEEGNLILPDNMTISKESSTLLIKEAKSIFSDTINENVFNIHPSITVNSDGKLSSRWDINYLQEFLSIESLIISASEVGYKICARSDCNNFFTPPKTGQSKKYCCEQCRIIDGKRKQRLRDKLDPDRERQLPYFQDRKQFKK